MKRSRAFLAVFTLASLLGSAAAAQTIPELFQKAKAEVKAESWQDALKTLGQLDAEAAKPGNEAVKVQLEGPMAFYRAVCEANLGQADQAKADFAKFLTLQPNASVDPAMHSRKAVAAFEAAQKEVAPPSRDGKSPSIFAAFQEFKAPPNSAEVVNEQWGDGPAKWLMTPDEKRDWALLTSGSDRAEFVTKFWAVRNPRPGTEDNTAKTSFDRRVAFSDTYFVQDEKLRGSLTDRGMVFVLLGPPTYAGRRPIRTGEDASEAEGLSTSNSHDAANARVSGTEGGGKISSGARAVNMDATGGPGKQAVDSHQNWREVWHYRKELLPKGAPYNQVDVDFVTKKGYGVNILQRDHTILVTLNAARGVPVPAP